MKKTVIIVMSLVMALGIAGCTAEKEDDTIIIGGSDGPTSIFIAGKLDEDETQDSADATMVDEPASDVVTDEQALTAIKNYCYMNNPDLEDIEKAGEYPVYWEIISSDEKEIVILFRSYTGAEIRYYIDPISGETYVTEFVPGITDKEERTSESFNVREF